jgi:predicted ATPase
MVLVVPPLDLEGMLCSMIRTPDQRLRVFVSSTLHELAAERAAARRAIERLRLTPVLFELGARPHAAADLYRAYLEQSHLFIGIYWQEYGWVVPDAAVSGIEDEYLLAGSRPKLIYLRQPAGSRDVRLNALLDRIREDGAVSYRYFTTPQQLARLIQDDLATVLSERFEDASERRPAPAGIQPVPVPVPASAFIGREAELERVEHLLEREDTRLVTLTGPGGIGKTRLARQVAAQLQSGFRDGVAVALLAPVTDPSKVVGTLADALGVPDAAGLEPEETLHAYLRERELLLLVDNFEHVVAAAPTLADVLASAPGVKLLVTSRQILRLTGEREVPVGPLALPEAGAAEPHAERSDAVRLFLDRARPLDSTPGSDGNLAAVVEICCRLDGLPLAIELAAARTRVLTPEAIMRRFGHPLTCLRDGPRDLPERQRTLRDTIRWSYDLLEAADRSFFESLAVFVGSWSLEAAEAIASPAERVVVFDLVTSLVDKSLVRQTDVVDGEPRFGMLQTIQEFAVERLAARGDLDRVRARYIEYFIGLAEIGGPELLMGDQHRWMQRFAADQDNLRSTLRELLGNGQAGRAARLGWSVMPFWWVGSQFAEGIEWMHQALASSGLDTDERTLASRTLGILAFGFGDLDCAEAALEDNVIDPIHGEYAASSRMAHAIVGVIKALRGDLAAGDAMVRESVAASQTVGDAWGAAFGRYVLGRVLLLGGRASEAISALKASVSAVDGVSANMLSGLALLVLGWAYLEVGDLPAAKRSLLAALDIVRVFGNRDGTARALEALAAVAAAGGDAPLGAQLFGAARAARASVGVSVWLPDHQSHDRTQRALEHILGADVFAERLREGAALHIERVPELLAELQPRPTGFISDAPTRKGHATPARFIGRFPSSVPRRRQLLSGAPARHSPASPYTTHSNP